jgi:predicted DNA-binding transcriptional regulator AlpA
MDETAPSLTMTTREFISLAGISRSTFYNLKRAGKFRDLAAPIPNRWRRADVIRWLETGVPEIQTSGSNGQDDPS